MSNSARKARKRASEKFYREPKIGTPIEDRWGFRWVNHPGDAATGVPRSLRPRSEKSTERIISSYEKAGL